MTMPGGAELIIILFIVLLLFGAKKLPDLAGSMGKSMREFRKASKEALEEDEAEAEAAARERDEAVRRADRDVES
jgi:sec-independent protein translocase protein TatA